LRQMPHRLPVRRRSRRYRPLLALKSMSLEPSRFQAALVENRSAQQTFAAETYVGHNDLSCAVGCDIRDPEPLSERLGWKMAEERPVKDDLLGRAEPKIEPQSTSMKNRA
ncbi:hypothetical protein KTN05_16440, partial [Paracoccus sp. Z118]|uniref:hypothetical protein n=1 Tax=Paracoccus sp. Z118 TaxID=2851017 RepID=UPI001C2B8210